MTFPFYKLVGAGNDFIFVDAKLFPNSDEYTQIAKHFCNRKWGIGADGFVFMETLNLETQQFRWHFYNDDGSSAEMCGNAARCAVLYCFNNFQSSTCEIETLAGNVLGTHDPEKVTVSWDIPSEQMEKKTLSLESNKTVSGFFINTGVPHFVVNTSKQKINGRDCLLIQEHKEFQPQQTNVTLLDPSGSNNTTKSFERGVKNFTLACGTGVIASAFVLKQIETQEVYYLQAPGGEMQVQINETNVTLSGPAQETFSGSALWNRG